MITLPHANNQEISDLQFLAAWNFWFNRFQPNLNPLTDSMPRLHAAESLAARLGNGIRFSFDILCRMLARPAYRNGMQATNVMLLANPHLLEGWSAINPIGGKTVLGVRLTEQGRKLLQDILVDPALDELIDAFDEADEADGPQDHDSNVEVESVETETLPFAFPLDVVKQLVSDIERDSFSPMYRNQCIGVPVTGWRSRIGAYFWPRPSTGYIETCEALAPMLETAEQLARAIGRWTPAQQTQAVNFAEEVFLWGGVSQRRAFGWQDVEAVFISAIEGRPHNDARMNSGWTKVAAFATAHLEPERSLVIWDSRVAHAIILRLDKILVKAGHKEVPAQFRDIGWVPGRGGSRIQRNPYRLKGWKSGYQRWVSVYAGSALVRAIRDELNARENMSMLDEAKPEPWTLRQVEMVLFMDGY